MSALLAWPYWYAAFEVVVAVGIVSYLYFNKPGGPT